MISVPEFLQASRHAGYRTPAHAVAELVDNAIQAGAASVSVTLTEAVDGLEVVVQDDGGGMSEAELRAALRFGGSSRFGDRSGLGRFGMGLPTSSLSQARRVEVYSWQGGRAPTMLTLDLDRFLSGAEALPEPRSEPLPVGSRPVGASGTLVRWSRCDRLGGQRLSSLAGGLARSLGRTFRRFIWDGLKLLVNGSSCPAADPMLLDPRAPASGAIAFGDPIQLRLRTALGVGDVAISFSELPVQEWHQLTVAEKRRLGVTKGAGVSILRAGREVDAGWFFMGDKRRENYDDWWRCEVAFSPELDEAFGLTYTKQQIRPNPEVVEALTPEVSAVARALNARVRRAHETVSARARFAPTERRVAAVEGRMRPLPEVWAPKGPLAERLGRLWPEMLVPPARPEVRIVEDDLGPAPLFEVLRVPNRLVVVWNTAHPFYKLAYAPLASSDEPGASERRTHLELLIVALARAEAARPAASGEVEVHRGAWSAALAELMKG